MGGYGALHFAFAHPELFSAVSAQSAALIIESPQQLDAASKTGVPFSACLARCSDLPSTRGTGTKIIRSSWRRKMRRQSRKLAIYFNCGDDDNYGFEKGAAAASPGTYGRARKARISRLSRRSQPAIFPRTFRRSDGVPLESLRASATPLILFHLL